MNEEKIVNSLIPYPTIVLAVDGDVTSINAVLKHYAGYIATLSTRTYIDELGRPYQCVDENLKRRLETKLITKILAFNAV